MLLVCTQESAVSELATELYPVPGSEDLLNLYCSAVGKPAPGISTYPSQALVPTQEYSTENLNTTVTVTKIHNISLKTVRSLGLQHLVVFMTHPLRNEEKIVPLPVNQEGTMDHFLNWKTAIAFITLFFASCVASIILCICLRKKRMLQAAFSLLLHHQHQGDLYTVFTQTGSHEHKLYDQAVGPRAVSELATELYPVPGSEDLLNLYCSAVGKPAPGISTYPSQALVPTQEYSTENLNTTVTVTKIHNISLKTVRSLGLRHLVVSMTHPLRNEEKIVPLPVNQE
ncbi:hypothetical protein STEG23_006311, partial [Scotinomys teguina]